jgi:hypothetical protein
MGNVFCGSKEENTKASAFQSPSEGDISEAVVNDQPTLQSSAPQHRTNSSSSLPAHDAGPDDPAEAARLQALREEEARLQLILQTAGRGMVAVRSTRGSTAYYDQGFAAALYQHLEQTTKFPENLPTQLPPSSSNTSSSVYARLSKPPWQDIVLGKQQVGLAGCAGENPHTYMDHEAEAFLDQVRPKKERLFAGASPMVKNLL